MFEFTSGLLKKSFDPYKMDPFTRQYAETALWSSNDESTPQGGEPMDKNYSIENLAPETLEKFMQDCKSFREQAGDLIARSGYDDEQAGHDFWLTRNHHGAGFWDGDIKDKQVADALTELSHKFGEVDLYIGDDGQIYQG